MSKIYEALLRAEMDRVAQLGQQQDPAISIGPKPGMARRDQRFSPRGIPGPRVEEPRSFGVDTGLQGASSPAKAAAPSSAATEPASLPTGAETSIPTVAQVEWHPDEARLPALQARGANVEQIRALRARMHELRANGPLKTVLISSGLPEEGKSFIAANLAIGFANHRSSRVLLIDGDMRRGTQHKLLGTHNTPGLTEYLSGAASLEEIIQQPRLDSVGDFKGLATLTFIPCGQDADNASDLSGNGRFEKLLEEREAFDWIVVDSSPVNLVADGANLARACDGVVLVARGGVTKYETAQRALQELKAAKLLGVVLNAVKGMAPAGGYYGYDK